MLLGIENFLELIDKNLHSLVVKNTIDYTYIVNEVSRILINLYIEQNFSKILKTGKSEDEICQVSFELNNRHEPLKFDPTTQELINYEELNELYTEMIIQTLIS